MHVAAGSTEEEIFPQGLVVVVGNGRYHTGDFPGRRAGDHACRAVSPEGRRPLADADWRPRRVSGYPASEVKSRDRHR
jgi:hypothetical protein